VNHGFRSFRFSGISIPKKAEREKRISSNMIHFSERGRVWETKSFPNGIRSRNLFPMRKSRSFKAFEPMDILHPEENGGSEADFAEQSA